MSLTNWKPKCGMSPYNEYGKVLKVSWFVVLVGVCLITPATNWLIPFLRRFEKYEVGRITIHNR